MLDKRQTLDLYRRRAGVYDPALRLYPLLGFRLGRYRRLAVNGLALRRGDTAVDLGCGTGLNLPLLRSAVGAEGRVVGVDLTDAMLARAGDRIARAGWRNVDLVRADAADYPFPAGVGGVLSTLAMTMVPEYDDVIRRTAAALRPGGRLSLFELKMPKGWPDWLLRLGVALNKPWGLSLDYAERHPWESVFRHLSRVSFTDLYFGAAYVAVGEVREGSSALAEQAQRLPVDVHRAG